jgi:hypothetical protein
MAEGTHLHLGLLRAWELWFQGKDIKGDNDLLWGLALIWWSRIGVAAGFLGGMVIVFDILGEERVRRYGLNLWRRWQKKSDLGWLGGPRALMIMAAYAAIVSSLALYVTIRISPNPLAWLPIIVGVAHQALLVSCLSGLLCLALSSDRAMAYIRLFALAMLVISAHFTLLTS